MQVVNGYVCQTCCDVDLAKRNVDPAHPDDDPKSAKYDPKKAAADRGPSVIFGGALAKPNGAQSVQAGGAPTTATASGFGLGFGPAATSAATGLQMTGSLLNLSA